MNIKINDCLRIKQTSYELIPLFYRTVLVFIRNITLIHMLRDDIRYEPVYISCKKRSIITVLNIHALIKIRIINTTLEPVIIAVSNIPEVDAICTYELRSLFSYIYITLVIELYDKLIVFYKTVRYKNAHCISRYLVNRCFALDRSVHRNDVPDACGIAALTSELIVYFPGSRFMPFLRSVAEPALICPYMFT